MNCQFCNVETVPDGKGEYWKCPKCNSLYILDGKGFRLQEDGRGKGKEKCPACRGTGSLYMEGESGWCIVCHGTGEQEVNPSPEVKSKEGERVDDKKIIQMFVDYYNQCRKFDRCEAEGDYDEVALAKVKALLLSAEAKGREEERERVCDIMTKHIAIVNFPKCIHNDEKCTVNYCLGLVVSKLMELRKI